MQNNLTATIILYYIDGSDQWHTMYKTKIVIPSTQTDFLPQHKLNYILHSWPSKHSLLISGLRYYYMIDLFAAVMFVPRIVCVWYSTVNIGKCKQQVTELLFHMIIIKFWIHVWIHKWQHLLFWLYMAFKMFCILSLYGR
jgi:hypothetical protein